MQVIIAHRLDKAISLFANKTIEYAVKIVVVRSTDIRQLLKVLRVAVANLLNNHQSILENKIDKFVTLAHVHSACCQLFANSVTAMVTKLPHWTKIVLLSIFILDKSEEECNV
jgi:Cdc6-like AAA superfamily ATPase